MSAVCVSMDNRYYWIQEERKRLEALVNNYSFNLLSNDVLMASRRMDQIIIDYYQTVQGQKRSLFPGDN